MDLRAWFVEIATGNVVAPARLADGSNLGVEIGGGTMSAEVVLAKYARPDGSPDVAVIGKLLDYCIGGRYTLLLTDGQAVVGEWLIWTHDRNADAGTIPITGFAWEKYPKFRSTYNTTNVTNVDAGEVHSISLHRAYNLFQPDNAELVSVPTPKFGQKVTLKVPVRTAYYSEIVDDMDQLALAEWRVVSAAKWKDGAPQSVTRRVEYAVPRFSNAHPDRLVKPGLGERGGNVVELIRRNDYSRTTRAVIAWGAGEGGKQRFVEELQSGWLQGGFISITKNVNFPGEYNDAQLAAKARGELAASQSYWDPPVITLDTRRMGALPQLGSVHQLTVGQSWTFPAGWSTTVRVGAIQYVTGTDLIRIEVEEI